MPEVPSGPKSSLLSPPHDISDSSAERTWPGNHWPEYKGEAMHTIPEECERLFCDKLSATFLGERSFVRQESLGMDAFDNQPNQIGHQRDRIQRWIEVLDYSADAIYRGFLAEHDQERTLFVFFEDCVLDNGLKSGYVRPCVSSERVKAFLFCL
jgi:hypothetical protein